MAKSKKEIEKIILEQTNFVPRNEKGQEIYISLKSKKNGKKNMSWYGTPYGNMLAGIEVTGMDVQESEDLIDVNIDYILEMNYEHVSDAVIHIRIMAKDSGLFRLM